MSAFFDFARNLFTSRVMSFENGIFIVGIEYSLHLSSKKPKVGSDVNTRVCFVAKFAKNKSRIWSDPLPIPIMFCGILRNPDRAKTNFSPCPRGYSLTSEIFRAFWIRSCWNCFPITKFSLESSLSTSEYFSGFWYPFNLEYSLIFFWNQFFFILIYP